MLYAKALMHIYTVEIDLSNNRIAIHITWINL